MLSFNAKHMLRHEIRMQINSVSLTQRMTAATAVVDRIRSLPVFSLAKTILGFVPLPTEPDISPLLDEAISMGKTVLLPGCPQENELIFHAIDDTWRDHLVRGDLGIREPDPSTPAVDLATMQNPILVLVPGLAFTPHCYRLGRGKGCYDRFLGNRIPGMTSIGVCLDIQMIVTMPVDRHDRPVDMVVTDRMVY